MAGGEVPYHLRKNKAIDRAIFMELLERLNHIKPIMDYEYIGFGALRMDDFKLVHSRFDIKKMTSIEMDPVIYSRQLFNQPLNCINIIHTTSGEFITNFIPDNNNIIWLDYTSPSELGQQIGEVRELLPKLQEFDVLKVTLNANPNTLKTAKPWEDYQQVLEKRLSKLIKRVNLEYFPHAVTSELMNDRDYPNVLLNLLELTSLETLNNTGLIFQPVLSFVYRDGQQMLTLTGIILSEEIYQQTLDLIGLNTWDFSNLTWSNYQTINTPDLTLKEQLFLDSLMPCNDTETIFPHIRLLFDETENETEEKIRNYLKYYRYYPYFTRALI